MSDQTTSEATTTTPAAPSALEQLANVTREPRDEGGVVLSATFIIQCIGCGERLVYEMVPEHPEDLAELPTDEVGCPTCTKNAGGPVVIPVAAAAGLQVAALEELWEGNNPITVPPPEQGSSSSGG